MQEIPPAQSSVPHPSDIKAGFQSAQKKGRTKNANDGRFTSLYDLIKEETSMQRPQRRTRGWKKEADSDRGGVWWCVLFPDCGQISTLQ